MSASLTRSSAMDTLRPFEDPISRVLRLAVINRLVVGEGLNPDRKLTADEINSAIFLSFEIESEATKLLAQWNAAWSAAPDMGATR